MSRPDFWADHEHAKGIAKKREALSREIATWTRLKEDVRALLDMAKEDAASDEDLKKEFEGFETKFRELEFFVLFSGNYDDKDCIVAIHAGTGGTEAQDWAEMLTRMYMRFCERKELGVRVLDESRGQETGLKSIVFEVSGRYAYGWLKSERGVHRLV